MALNRKSNKCIFVPYLSNARTIVAPTVFVRLTAHFCTQACCTYQPPNRHGVMFGILPVLHENQTLYSWCGLTHALTGSTCVRTTSTRLFGTPYAALSHDFPSRLIALEHSTGGALGCVGEIALRNTLLGYYLAIVRQTVAKQIIGLLNTGSIPHLKMLLGITASRVGGHHPLKGCEKCFAEDEDSHGWAYWHVEHQLPSVFVCSKHHSPLSIAWDPVTPVHRRHWLLPRHDEHYSWTQIRVTGNAAMNRLLRLAIDSERLMRLHPAALEPAQLTHGYQCIMQDSGLATKNGNLRTVRLVSLIKQRYRGLEGLPGLAPLKAIDDQWPGLAASLSRRVSRPGHPLKHLLLIGAITDSWDQFIEACALPTIPVTPSAPTTEVQTASRLVRFKELITVQGKSVRAASHSLGVTTTTGTQWAKKLKVTYTSHGKPIAKTIAAKIRRMLEKGDSISSIAIEASVSITTVNRIVGSDPKISEKRNASAFSSQQLVARRNFTNICRKHSNQPLNRIRSKPGNSYMWLYRNDHQWLTSKLAEHGRISSRHH